MQVGIIGLGLIGRAIARRLIDAGHTVSGFDISADAMAAAAKDGVSAQVSATDVAASADILFLCLLTSDDRRDLLWGDRKFADQLREQSTIVDVSTGRPTDFAEDHARLRERNVRLVDICITGSSEAVASGEAIALIGAAKDGSPFEPLVETFTRSQHYLDEPGAGLRMKLVVNLVIGLNRLVLAEALSLAQKGGHDLKETLDVLKDGGAYSAVMDTKGSKMITGAFDPPAARLAQHAKDVHLIMEYAEALGAEVPVTELHAHLIDGLVKRGLGDLDNAAIIKAYE